MYGYICLVGSRKFVRFVINWEQDCAFLVSYFLDDVLLTISHNRDDIILL